jgi:hypothetical protein
MPWWNWWFRWGFFRIVTPRWDKGLGKIQKFKNRACYTSMQQVEIAMFALWWKRRCWSD